MLKDEQRLIVVVDALDEGIGVEKESIPSCIPAGIYEGVVFLLSYRVDQSNKSQRVERQLKHIDAQRMQVLQHANPLSGLNFEDVQLFLNKLLNSVKGTFVSEQTEQQVWEAANKGNQASSSKGADPFFLRFLADGVLQGSIRLDRAETVPLSLDEAFEEMWMSLPSDHHFLCHRILLTLGIMREYGDDELFMDLFNKALSPHEQLSPNDVASVRIKAGKLLVYDDERYGLFHDRFRVFLVGEQKDPIAAYLEEEVS